MPLYNLFGISASALTANRLWLDLISNNIANMHTAGRPGDVKGTVYRRQVPLFCEQLRQALNDLPATNRFTPSGVQVVAVVKDPSAPRMVYEPAHPLADPDTGYVAYPNVNITNEMVNMVIATRSYEANVTVINATKEMALKTLEIGRR